MKVTALKTYFLSVALRQTVRTSIKTIFQVSKVIVKLATDAGPLGIGEARGPFLFQEPPWGPRAVDQSCSGSVPFDTVYAKEVVFLSLAEGTHNHRSLVRRLKPSPSAFEPRRTHASRVCTARNGEPDSTPGGENNNRLYLI